MAYIKDTGDAVTVAGIPGMRIDDTDFAILKCINDADRPLWKNKIHECITENAEQLPIVSSVSVQTVGRRVDSLTEDEYLESVIISPDEIKRDLIIAFKLTEQGGEAITEKSEKYLQRVAQAEIFGDQEELGIGKPALLELLQEKFELDSDAKSEMESEYSENDLVTLIVIYYVREEIVDAFTEENVERLFDLTKVNGELAQALDNYMKRHSDDES